MSNSNAIYPNRKPIQAALEKYGEREREILIAALDYADSALGGDREQFCQAMGLSWAPIHKTYNGTYEAGIDGIVQAAERMLGGAATMAGALIETPVVKKQQWVYSMCRKTGRMGAVVADTGRGKTFTAQNWLLTQPKNSAFYCQLRSGSNRADMVKTLCLAVGIPADELKQPQREHELFAKLRKKHMLIVDEAGYSVRTSRRGSAPIRLLQDLYDQIGLPIVMIFRRPHWDSLTSGHGWKEDEQLVGRIAFRAIVPPEFYQEEVASLVGHFSQEKSAYKTACEILLTEAGGIRTLVDDLAWARLYSEKRHVPFPDALIQARNFRESGGHWGELTPIK